MQVSVAKTEAHQRESDLRSLSSEKQALRDESSAAAQREREALLQRVEAAAAETTELRRKHRHEMGNVEARVLAMLAVKDETIAALREQLGGAHEQLRETEAVLAAQQAELDF